MKESRQSISHGGLEQIRQTEESKRLHGDECNDGKNDACFRPRAASTDSICLGIQEESEWNTYPIGR